MAIVNDYEVIVRGVAEMFRNYEDRVEVVELDARTPVSTPVDVALYDTFAQGHTDPARTREILGNGRVRRLAIYTWDFVPRLATESLAAGASAYLSKSMPAEQLVRAVEKVHEGQRFVSPIPGRTTPPAGSWPAREEGLTPRESEVLCLIAQGMSNQDIAARTALSINSVKSYIRTAYRKIGTTSRTQAVLWGIEHGLRPDRVRIDPSDVAVTT